MSRWDELRGAILEAAEESASRRHQAAELARDLLSRLHSHLDCASDLMVVTGLGGGQDSRGYALDTGVSEVELVTHWLDGDREWTITLLSTVSTVLGQKGFRVRLRFSRDDEKGAVAVFVENGSVEETAGEATLQHAIDSEFTTADVEALTAALQAEMIRQLLA